MSFAAQTMQAPIRAQSAPSNGAAAATAAAAPLAATTALGSAFTSSTAALNKTLVNNNHTTSSSSHFAPAASSAATRATAAAPTSASPPPFSSSSFVTSGARSTHARTSSSAAPSAAIAAASTTYARAFSGSAAPTHGITSVFKVKPELDPLERERREIERRRERFEDRRKRVLHAKTRVIGVDVDGLSAQIQERQERERLESERSQYYDDRTSSHAKQLTALEQRRQLAESQRMRELTFFRQQQAMEKQIKDSIERAAINNVNDMDTTLLKFAGEDLEYKDRAKMQQLQQQDWCAQQIYERADREAQERQAEAEYAAYQDRITAAQMANEAARMRAVAERNANNAAYNAHLMGERRAQEARDRAVSAALDETELVNTFHSALLTEDNSKDGNRGYMFKGFSVEQRQAVLDEQARQIEEARQRRARERNEEKEYADEMERVRRLGVRMEMQKQRRDAEQRLAVRDERLWQARQKHVRDSYLTNVVYTNPVREEYFDQFGTSCR